MLTEGCAYFIRYFGGILTIFLVKKFNPFIDNLIIKIENKITPKLTKGVIAFLIIFLMLDCMVTCYAQDAFITRIVLKNDIEIKDLERREKDYQKIEENEYLSNFVDKYWNDKKMIITFPNMKIEDKDGNIIYLDSLLPDIQPYYKKIFEK